MGFNEGFRRIEISSTHFDETQMMAATRSVETFISSPEEVARIKSVKQEVRGYGVDSVEMALVTDEAYAGFQKQMVDRSGVKARGFEVRRQKCADGSVWSLLYAADDFYYGKFDEGGPDGVVWVKEMQSLGEAAKVPGTVGAVFGKGHLLGDVESGEDFRKVVADGVFEQLGLMQMAA